MKAARQANVRECARLAGGAVDVRDVAPVVGSTSTARADALSKQ